MNRMMHLLRGTVRLRACGPFPERLINLCALNRVDFWGVEWTDETTLHLIIYRRDRARTEELARRVDCTLEEEDKRGLPFFLARFRTRYAFLAGLAASLLAVSLMSNVVLSVQVTGNEKVPTAVILGELSRLGVRPGVFGPGLDRGSLAQSAVLGLDGVAWMTINLHGTRAEVIVREATAAPELAEEDGFCDILSEADGMIEKVEALEGEAQVQPGDLVLQGEVLISGVVSMEPPQYSGLPVRYYQTRARGRVYARTWRTLSAQIPLQAAVKTYTGEEKNHWSLTVLNHRMDFFQNSSISWPTYDKIRTEHPLPWAEVLPVRLTAEKIRAYEISAAGLDRDAAQTLLEEQLTKRLEQMIGEDGEIVSTQFTVHEGDTALEVTLRAECREEIGLERETGPDPRVQQEENDTNDRAEHQF